MSEPTLKDLKDQRRPWSTRGVLTHESMKRLTLALFVIVLAACFHDDEGCASNPTEPTPTEATPDAIE